MNIAPLIVIGMHRSGTSLVARLLQSNGCFMGADQIPEHQESHSFVSINDWLLHQSNANWDYPENWLDLPSELQEYFLGFVELKLQQNWQGYLPEPYSKYAPDPHSSKIIWGWKDPRSSLTHALWGKLFPSARFLHVYRNPIDVANSLFKREQSRCQNILDHTQNVGYENYFNKVDLIGFSARSRTLSGNIDIWRKYVESCLCIDERVPEERRMHLRYEDLLEKPQEVLPAVLDFAKINRQEDTYRKSLAEIRSGRRYAFLEQPKLVEEYRKIQTDPLVTRLGYGNLL